MLEALQSFRRSWAPFLWGAVTITMCILFSLALLTINTTSDRKLGMACDRVVERLLTTHDAVELERSRILVHALACGISRRVSDWPPSRTGGLVP